MACWTRFASAVSGRGWCTGWTRTRRGCWCWRERHAATVLTAAFAAGEVRKLYWAVVVGVPATAAGRIEQPLSKRFGAIGERMAADEAGAPP